MGGRGERERGGEGERVTRSRGSRKQGVGSRE